jgi:hypothetical protein
VVAPRSAEALVHTYVTMKQTRIRSHLGSVVYHSSVTTAHIESFTVNQLNIGMVKCAHELSTPVFLRELSKLDCPGVTIVTV